MANSDDKPPVVPLSEFNLEEAPIGRGGFGTVYKGRHPTFGLVAIKTLIDSGLIPKKHIRTLEREAKIIRKLSSNEVILRVHCLIMERDNYSLVTEFMVLGGISEFTKNFGVHWPLISRFVCDITSGMDFLHSQNPPVFHNDLKGDNILINESMRAKIGDFGLSEWRCLTSTVTRGNTQGSRQGTVSHIPPEVWIDVNIPADKGQDVYSFGIVLWEAITGKVPYGKLSDELVRSAVLSGQRPDFRAVPRECPAPLQQMMTRAWHQKAQQRPLFSSLCKEAEEIFQNFSSGIVKSLKDVRAKICEEYEEDEDEFTMTSYIDNMRLEPPPEERGEESSLPSSSQLFDSTESMETQSAENSQSQISDSQTINLQPGGSQLMTFAPEVDEEPSEVHSYKKDKGLPREEMTLRKFLRHPVLLHMASLTDLSMSMGLSPNMRKTLTDPRHLQKYLKSDLALQWETKYMKFDPSTEMRSQPFAYAKKTCTSYVTMHEGKFNTQEISSWAFCGRSAINYKPEDPTNVTHREKVHVSLGSEFEPASLVSSDGVTFENEKVQKLGKALQSADEFEKLVNSGNADVPLATIPRELVNVAKDANYLFPVLFRDHQLLYYLANSKKKFLMKLAAEAIPKERKPDYRNMRSSHPFGRSSIYNSDDETDKREMNMAVNKLAEKTRRGQMSVEEFMEQVQYMNLHGVKDKRSREVDKRKHRDRRKTEEDKLMDKNRMKIDILEDRKKDEDVTRLRKSRDLLGGLRYLSSVKSLGHYGRDHSPEERMRLGLYDSSSDSDDRDDDDDPMNLMLRQGRKSQKSSYESLSSTQSSSSSSDKKKKNPYDLIQEVMREKEEERQRVLKSQPAKKPGGIMSGLYNYYNRGSLMTPKQKQKKERHEIQSRKTSNKNPDISIKSLHDSIEYDYHIDLPVEMSSSRYPGKSKLAKITQSRTMPSESSSSVPNSSVPSSTVPSSSSQSVFSVSNSAPKFVQIPVPVPPTQGVNIKKEEDDEDETSLKQLLTQAERSEPDGGSDLSLDQPASDFSSFGSEEEKAKKTTEASPTCTVNKNPKSDQGQKNNTREGTPVTPVNAAEVRPGTRAGIVEDEVRSARPRAPESRMSPEARNTRTGSRPNQYRAPWRDVETDAFPSLGSHPESLSPMSGGAGVSGVGRSGTPFSPDFKSATTNKKSGATPADSGAGKSASSYSEGLEDHHVFQHQHSGGAHTKVRLNPNTGGFFNINIGDHMNLTYNERPRKQKERRRNVLKLRRFSDYENEEEVSTNDINVICEYIGSQWQELGRHLGFEKPELEAIEIDYKIEGTAEIAYQMLKSWKERSEEPTLGHLISCLHCIQRDDISQLIVDAHEAMGL